jgi:hypothetical protein
VHSIFISYRRDDSEGEAGRLYADLVKEFGQSAVFMDVDAIQKGRDFRKAIDESVGACGVLLAVIGRDWLGERLQNPTDFVRLEIASALKRNIAVIPVLVHGAVMPPADQLPADLQDLAYRNGSELTHARWNSDLQLLVNALRPYVAWKKPNRFAMVAGVVAAGLAAVALGAFLMRAPRISNIPDNKTDTASNENPAKNLPNFGGVWELTDGPGIKGQRLVLTQKGRQVRMDNRTLTITPAGTIGYQMFAAHDSGSGHTVATAQEADLVDTLTWSVSGSTLVFETIFDYQHAYGGHAPGKEVRVMKYRRVTP